MKTEPDYDSFYQALVDLRKSLDDKINSLDDQIRSAQLKYLEDTLQQQKDALAECLDGIDQQLIKLSVYVEEYQRLQASLSNLQERIPQLGRASPAMPEMTAGNTLVETLAGWLDHLKSQGKIRDQ